MTKIEDMIKELCPNGVEWKELGEVCEIIRGSGLQKKDFVDTGVPCIHYGQIYTYYDSYVYETKSFVSQNLSEKIKKAKSGDLIIATTSENIEDVGKSIVWLGDGDVCIGGHSCVVRTKENPKYIHYCMQSIDFQKQKEQRVVGTKVIELYPKKLSKIKIPIPPLKVQEEIVKILDKFTDYVTELTSELTLRQKQCSFYRDKLLSFEDEAYQVEWKTLKDVAKLKNGKDWKNLPSGKVPVYGSGGEMGEFVSDYSYNKPTVLIPRKGSISNLFYIEEPFWNVDTIYYTEIDESQIMPRYFYYYLTTIDLEGMATNPTRPSLTQSILDKIELPVPSLEIQSRIVQVLDNFDTVCNDLNIGLPKEIELRQKQYEFFRDKLLTFAAEGVYIDSTVQYRQDLIRLLQWVFGPIRVELGCIATIVRGASPRPISKFVTDSEDGIPWIKIGDVEKDSKYVTKTKEKITRAGSVKSRFVHKGDFIMSNSMSFGRPYILEIDGCIHDGWLALSDFESVCEADYLYHYLLTDDMQHTMRQNASNGTVQNLNADIVRKLVITLPPFSDQSRIVSILDKFDDLTSSISTGLPKEIEQRQKQYEYFSDKLLRF